MFNFLFKSKFLGFVEAPVGVLCLRLIQIRYDGQWEKGLGQGGFTDMDI